MSAHDVIGEVIAILTLTCALYIKGYNIKIIQFVNI